MHKNKKTRMYYKYIQYVSPGIEKSTLFVLPSYKIIVREFVYIRKTVLSHDGPARGCETQLGLLYESP
jgi:hypothetical protein